MSQELNLSEEDYRTLAEMYMEEVEQRFRRRRPFVSSAGIRLRIMRDQDCSRKTAGEVADEIAVGQLQNMNGVFFKSLADLAIANPDGTPSLLGPNFTNLQAFRFVFYGNVIVGFHFFGGNLGGPFYSDETRNLLTVSGYSYYMPHLLWQEIDAVNCSSMDVTFDDNLELINVPILYIGANGGSGAEAGYYTGTLTASADITNHLVSVNGDPATDFGHVDMWVGNDADQLVWSKLHSWIKSHK